MFSLLNSITTLFSNKQTQLKNQDTGYSVNEATDQVIDGIDPKLRLVPGHQKFLQQEVSNSLAYICKLVDKVTGPTDISRKTFIDNPEVRAYFSTPDVLMETFSCGTELKTFFEQQDSSSSETCCALLCADKKETQVTGSALEGDVLRRDVLQTAISFFDYKILSPAETDKEVRQGIKRCIFDGLVTYALLQIADLRLERSDLSDRRRILHAQLRSRQSHGGGLSKLLAEAQLESEQLTEIEEELRNTEIRLEEMTGDKDVLSFYLEEIRKVLAQPEKFIQLNLICYHLNDMGIIVDESADQSANTVYFSELEITNVMKRIVTFIRYNRNDINCTKQFS